MTLEIGNLKFPKSMLQRTKYKILIYSLISVIIFTLLGFWAYFSTAQSRDYRRLADLRVWQNILSDYYAKNGTYVLPNCYPGQVISDCFRGDNTKSATNVINDPINSSPYQYIVTSLTDSNYEISFTLESGLNGLKPGQYIWTKNGVKK